MAEVQRSNRYCDRSNFTKSTTRQKFKTNSAMGTGKGWTALETVAACRAYVTASEDPRKGNNRKRELFLADVLQKYENEVSSFDAKEPLPKRTGAAVAQRYRKARCECLKMEGVILRIKNKKPTGSPSEEDIERAALAIYNGEANISDIYTFISDRTLYAGQSFVFRSALTFLRTTHTWNMVVKSQQMSTCNLPSKADDEKRTESDQSTVVKTESPGTHRKSHRLSSNRPMGTKRAFEIKEQLEPLNKGAEGIEKMAAASMKRTKVAQEMLEVDKQRALIELFSMSGTDPQLRQRFMKLKQEKAVMELEQEMRVIARPENIVDDMEGGNGRTGCEEGEIDRVPAQDVVKEGYVVGDAEDGSPAAKGSDPTAEDAVRSKDATSISFSPAKQKSGSFPNTVAPHIDHNPNGSKTSQTI